MAKLNSILFNRAIKQFLECEDLNSKKGKQLTEKLNQSANDFPEKILATITQSENPHKEVLKNICRQNIEGISEEFFLDSLSHDETLFRDSASEILTKLQPVKADKLFKRLHQRGSSKAEILELLSIQAKTLKPEEIINNAVKLDASYATQLLKIADDSKQPIDLTRLRFQAIKLKNPTFKAALVRYFGNVNQAEVVELITRFLTDSSKMVILEALSSLNRLNFRFDVSVVLPFIVNMTKVEQKLALEIIDKQSDSALIPKLPPYLSSKSQLINYLLYKVIARHATEESLEQFLLKLEQQDSWVGEQVINHLQILENEKLALVARSLSTHESEFVRSSAQKISRYQLDSDDLNKIGEFALNENWQVRQRALQTLAKSGDEGAISILGIVLDKWPDSAMSILDAVKNLGFGSGSKIALKCLGNAEASIQRAALDTIATITGKEQALSSRDSIISYLPKLNLELKVPANQIISELTSKFGLPNLSTHTDSAKKSPSRTREKLASKILNLKPGSTWMDRYHVKKEIGQGSMGQVILVEDEMIEEQVILKFMHPELTIDTASKERFKREVKYARRVGHPNVIRVHDLLLQKDVCAISMEYFEGRGLEKLLGECSYFETQQGLNILYQVSDGMAAAHDQAVIHRDLKPSNILVDDSGHVKIADFGIASAQSSAESTLTQTGSIIGSPAYLSPERATEMEADERSDIYSLGIIAYYMFSGELPYRGQPMKIIAMHREGNAPMVNEVNPAADARIAALIKKMMAVEPEDRPQTMTEVRDEIKVLMEQVQ